jgi:hypothetical protein
MGDFVRWSFGRCFFVENVLRIFYIWCFRLISPVDCQFVDLELSVQLFLLILVFAIVC